MKASFVFDFNKPEDIESYDTMRKAYDIQCGIEGFTNKLRSIIKYDSSDDQVIKELLLSHPQITQQLVYAIRDMFHDTLREYREDD